MKFVYTILAISLLASCRAGSPWQAWMFEGPPPGKEYPALYVEGWQDGCHTGAATAANHYYRFFYTYKQDPYKAQNKIYYRGWKDSFDYCYRYIYQYDRRAFF